MKIGRGVWRICGGEMGANLEWGQTALIQNHIFRGKKSSWSAV